CRRVHAPALGFHHHGLGPAMAEALLHHARADGAAGSPGLQRQGRAAPGSILSSTVFVLVRHAARLTKIRRRYARPYNPNSSRGGARAPPLVGLLAPTLREERTEAR